MSAARPGSDGYMTRGRAAAYERRLAEQQARHDAQIEGLQRQLDQLRAAQAELPRALVAAMLEVVRANGAGETARGLREARPHG